VCFGKVDTCYFFDIWDILFLPEGDLTEKLLEYLKNKEMFLILKKKLMLRYLLYFNIICSKIENFT